MPNNKSLDNDKRIVLVRDGSKLSSEVENYLIEGNMGYYVLYANENDYGNKLPAIFDPFLIFGSYSGDSGFYLFKKSHPIGNNEAKK